MYVYDDVRREAYVPRRISNPFSLYNQSVFLYPRFVGHRKTCLPRSTENQVTRVCGVLCDPPTHKHPVRRSTPDVHTPRGPPRDTDSTPGVSGTRGKHLPLTPTPTLTANRRCGPPTDPGAAQPESTPTTSSHGPTKPSITRNRRTVVLRPRCLSGPCRLGKPQTTASRDPEANRAHLTFYSPHRSST